MIADRKDFQASVQKRHAEASQRLLPMARVLAGAAPVIDSLQRSPEWQRYCSILQGIAERYAAGKQAALQKLSDPGITKDDDVRKLRQDLFEADVWLQAMKLAIELPGEILKGGKEAEEFLSKWEQKSADQTAESTAK